MKIQNFKNSKTITLCGRAKCCPKITRKLSSDNKDIITIEDDHGGKVELTEEQVKILPKAILELFN
jgi:hypothetical protein